MADAGTIITENIGTITEFNWSVVLKKETTAPGKGINTLIKSITLYSSLDDMCMSVEFSLVDSLNLVDDNYLQVGSIIEIDIYKSSDDPVEKKISKLRFYITNIDGQIQSKTQRQKGYDVAAYTFAAISNEWPLLEKIKENTPSEMIKNIAQRRFTKGEPKRLGLEENGDWIKTSNTIKNGIIFHQVKPFDAISQLLKKSVSTEYADSAFFFYEDYQGFKFKSLRLMASDTNKAKAWKYTFYPERNNTDDADNSVSKDFFRVLYLAQYNHTDYFNLIRSGLLRSELVFINLLTKETKTEKVFNSADAEEKKRLVNEVYLLGNNSPVDTSPRVFGENVPINGKDLDYDYTPASYIAISESAWERDDYIQEKYINARIQKQLLQQTKVTIEVYGNPAIKPGDILNLDIPARSSADGDLETRRQSGDFIVWAVKHTIKNNIFQTIIDLCKDSYEKDVTSPPNDNSVNS